MFGNSIICAYLFGHEGRRACALAHRLPKLNEKYHPAITLSNEYINLPTINDYVIIANCLSIIYKLYREVHKLSYKCLDLPTYSYIKYILIDVPI